MISDSDRFESERWFNIQEPIKEILMSLTKAIQTQSMDIEALDQKLTKSYLKKEKFVNSMVEVLKGFIPIEEKQQIYDSIDRKANNEAITELSIKLVQVNRGSVTC
jgi:acid stress-induced BolA-like protein IbaG/YrbA